MKYITISILVTLGISCFGQKTPTQDQIDDFLNTTTYVVMQANIFSAYNILIKKAVNDEWKITPMEFIEADEFESLRKKANASFLIVTYAEFLGDKTNTRYDFMNLIMGGEYTSLETMPDLVNIPLSIADVDESSYTNKLALFVRFIQNHLYKLSDEPGLCNVNFANLYNNKDISLAGKTIMFRKNELSKKANSPAKLKKVYEGKAKISTGEEIENAINNKRTNTLVAHIVGPKSTDGNKRCFKILIGIDDAEVYYFDYHTITANKPNGFLKKDFDRLNGRL